MTKPARNSQSAFTLVELMAVITIIGLMVMVAMPALKGIGGASQLGNAGRQFNNALMQARQYALTRRAFVRVLVASEETSQGSSVPDSIKVMKCCAYAIMYRETALTTTSTTKYPAQPNLPVGMNRWLYIQPWRFLPRGVVFDPAKQTLQSADNKVLLPHTTIFDGDKETTTNHLRTTRDELPIPDDISTKPYDVSFIEFKPSGTPTVNGSVRLVNGFVEIDGTLVIPGRQNPASSQGATDPAAKNSVVLQWDEIVGRVKWIQPGR